jgi:hypothetical protein
MKFGRALATLMIRSGDIQAARRVGSEGPVWAAGLKSGPRRRLLMRLAGEVAVGGTAAGAGANPRGPGGVNQADGSVLVPPLTCPVRSGRFVGLGSPAVSASRPGSPAPTRTPDLR